MKRDYYNFATMGKIILELFELLEEMKMDGNTDKFSLKDIQLAIDDLKYYRQFLKK